MIKHGQMRPHPSTDIQSYSVSRTIPKMVDSRFFDHFAERVAHYLIGCRFCRGVEGIVGPGRLTKAIGITGRQNGKVANEETGVWFSERPRRQQNRIMRSARIFDHIGQWVSGINAPSRA
jgi:3-methyladenine DNA glycosylase Mpg